MRRNNLFREKNPVFVTTYQQNEQDRCARKVVMNLIESWVNQNNTDSETMTVLCESLITPDVESSADPMLLQSFKKLLAPCLKFCTKEIIYDALKEYLNNHCDTDSPPKSTSVT